MQLLSCDLWLMERETEWPRFKQQFALMVQFKSHHAEWLAQTRAASSQSPAKGIGVIKVDGPIEARPTFFGQMMGMTSYETIGRQFDSLMADQSVGHIIFDIMSPGGMVYGCQELAGKIYRARGQGKKIVAYANHMAASGAYWLAAAADRVVMAPSGDVGSVGVIMEHVDMSQALEREGVKVTTIRSDNAPYKQEHNSAEPITDEGKTSFLSRANAIHRTFATSLATFRGGDENYVNEHYGKGRLVSAAAAIKAGMADKTFDSIQELAISIAAGRIRIASERAMDVWDGPTLREMRAGKVAAIQAASKATPTENA